MTKYVGLKELRQNVSKYAAGVRRGHEYVVMKHNKPLFKLSQVKDPWGDEGEWESVIDFTKIRKDGVPAEEVLAALERIEKEDRKKKRGG